MAGLTGELHAEMISFKLARKHLMRTIREALPEQDVKAEFAAHPDWYDGSRVRARHVFIDTSAGGYGQAKIGAEWRRLSPAHQVRPGLPPTLLLHGSGDATTPYQGAVLFRDAMAAAGNRCDLVTVEGAQHTYMFKDAALYAESQAQVGAFLASLGFLPATKN